jgi:hypothetical protein
VKTLQRIDATAEAPPRSRKLRALETVLGKDWWRVCLEWERKPMTQAQIAATWTALVAPSVPGINFRQYEVHRFIHRAREVARERAKQGLT